VSRVFGSKIYWIGNLLSAAVFYFAFYSSNAGLISGYAVLAGGLLALIGASATLVYVLKTTSPRVSPDHEDGHDERFT